MNAEDRRILNLTCEHIQPLLRAMVASGAGPLELVEGGRRPWVALDRGLKLPLAQAEASRRGLELYESTDPHYDDVTVTCQACHHSIWWMRKRGRIGRLVTTSVERRPPRRRRRRQP